MKYYGIIIVILCGLFMNNSRAATNCPNGATSCYKKAIYRRDIGTGNRSMQERELNKIYVFDHYDFGVHRVDLTDLECIGLFANSFDDAVWGAVAYLSLFGLNSSVGWVDATVRSSNNERGPVSITDDIDDIYYYLNIQLMNELKGPRTAYYHLILYACQSFAEDLYY